MSKFSCTRREAASVQVLGDAHVHLGPPRLAERLRHDERHGGGPCATRQVAPERRQDLRGRRVVGRGVRRARQVLQRRAEHEVRRQRIAAVELHLRVAGQRRHDPAGLLPVDRRRRVRHRRGRRSGRLAATAPGESTSKQTSSTVRPVSTPPASRAPPRNLASKLRDTKSLTRFCLPKFDDCVTRFDTAPNRSALTSYRPQT